MITDYKIFIKYTADGMNYFFEGTHSDHYEMVVSNQDNLFKVVLYPKTFLSNLSVYITMNNDFNIGTKVFANGYQSWSCCKEYELNERMEQPRGLHKFNIKNTIYGDGHFVKSSNAKGVFHGFTYGYTKSLSNEIDLIGSLTERFGFTIITYDVPNKTIQIRKELDGISTRTPYEVLNICRFTGSYDEVFDKYFSCLKVKNPNTASVNGYTSWYNNFTSISQKQIENDLHSFVDKKVNIDIFQIDDGYQAQVGDWLTLNSKFTDLKLLSDTIHHYNIKAGLWVAPFICTKKSSIFINHNDWLLKDSNGKYVIAGKNWRSDIYVLDIYNEKVRNYLRDVFDTILYKWNFDLVKLDFLYAACIIPYKGKTRAEIMTDAMDFLRAVLGNKLMLACGVPLATVFGKADFCRIGPDVSLKWGEKNFKKKTSCERVSNINAINNTIFRRHLNGRAFINDPDVVFLRDKNLNYTQEQKDLKILINKIFSNFMFISDDISTYNNIELSKLNDSFINDDIHIESADYIAKDTISVSYKKNGKLEKLCFNLSNGTII